MTYSGAVQVRQAKEELGKALSAIQQAPNLPDDVMAVAQNIAKATGGLFEAERASSERDGKACVKNALGSLSQTLALLQEVKTAHPGVGTATQAIANVMSQLFPLTTVPSKIPPPVAAAAVTMVDKKSPSVAPKSRTSVRPKPNLARADVEANIGATTESNFYVGFSGEISDGGVFLATYEVLAPGTPTIVLVTLPGGYEFKCDGHVRFVRDPFDLTSDSEPGMGIQFGALPGEARELVMRFIRKRAPMFYED